MMKKIAYYISLVVLVGFMAACSSTKKVGKLPNVGDMSGTEYMEKLVTSAPHWENLSGKASVELVLGKKGSTRVNGSLKIFRGEAIQLSVAPVLGIEVARLEITPEGLLIVDRVHKRFVQASFVEVSNLLQVELNFNILQSLFLNEIFLPGKMNLSSDDVSSFTLDVTPSHAVLQPKGRKKIGYQFLTSTQNGQLEHTRIGLRSTSFSLNWDYSDFTNLSGQSFPQRIKVNLMGLTDPYALNFKLSHLTVGNQWKGKTTLSSRYQEIKLQELIKALLKL